MKKFLLIATLALLAFTGCEDKKITEETGKTFTYESENGPIELPVKPMRIISLNMMNSGDFIALGGNVVGVDKWTKENPTFSELAKDIKVVSDEDLEGIIEMNPDLIITASTDKNIERLQRIAPTVTFSYGRLDYINRIIEAGKIINKEKEAEEWVANFRVQAKQLGEKVKAKYGEETSVTILESQNRQLYVFGENFGRGGDILYKEMGLKMPQKVSENTTGTGFYAISSEVLPEFVGDFLVYSKTEGVVNSFEETSLYQNMEAVKNGRVIFGDVRGFFFNDPVTLTNQLNLFRENFLGKE